MYAVINVDIKRDVEEVERLLRGLRNGAPKVLTRALNKTIRPVQTAAVKTLARDLRVTQKVVRAGMKLNKARWSDLSAEITVTGKRLPIIALGAKQTKKGVTYKGRGGGRKLIPSAFIATMPSGHTGVFARRGKSRTPIDELHGASIPYVFLKSHIQRAMDNEADSRWRKNIDYELKRFIRRGR